MKIIKLHTVDSTQAYLKDYVSRYAPTGRTVVMAEIQTRGVGRRGNKWISGVDKNLTFSIFIPDIHLPAQKFFNLQKSFSLILYRVLIRYYTPLYVKWPNDIMADGKKLSGILLDSQISGRVIKSCIAGIGINLNERVFPAGAGNAISLYQLTGLNYEPEELMHEITESFSEIESLLLNPGKLHRDYLSVLYLMGKPHVFYHKGKSFSGVIENIDPDGRLLVRNDSGKLLAFNSGEIRYEKFP